MSETDPIRAFIASLPTAAAADLDPAKRAVAEREIAQKVGALSATQRVKFESELREMNSEMRKSMSFSQRWTHARNHAALRKQIEGKGTK